MTSTTALLARGFAVAAATALALAACSPGSGEQGEGDAPPTSAEELTDRISFWAAPILGYSQEDMQALVDTYNASADVPVDLTWLEWKDARDKIRQAVAAGNGPDVWTVAPLDDAYVRAGSLVPVSGLGFTDDDIAQFQDVIRSAEFDGEIYAIPLGWHAVSLYVNTTVLSEYGFTSPPTTWDELYDMAATITTESAAAGDPVMGFQVKGMDDHLNAINQNWPMILGGFGGSLVSEDLSASTEDTPEAREALAFVKQFYDTGVSTIGVSAEKGFMDGTVAMFTFGHGLATTIAASTLEDEWTVAPLPDGPAGPSQYISSDALVANAAGGNIPAAGDFIRWMASQENTSQFMATGGVTPYRLDALDTESRAVVDGIIAEKPYLASVIERVEAADVDEIRMVSVAQAARWEAQATFIVAALSGQQDADSALGEIDSAVDRALG